MWYFQPQIFTLVPIIPKFLYFALQMLVFCLKHTVPVIVDANILQTFFTQLEQVK